MGDRILNLPEWHCSSLETLCAWEVHIAVWLHSKTLEAGSQFPVTLRESRSRGQQWEGAARPASWRWKVPREPTLEPHRYHQREGVKHCKSGKEKIIFGCEEPREKSPLILLPFDPPTLRISLNAMPHTIASLLSKGIGTLSSKETPHSEWTCLVPLCGFCVGVLDSYICAQLCSLCNSVVQTPPKGRPESINFCITSLYNIPWLNAWYTTSAQ